VLRGGVRESSELLFLFYNTTMARAPFRLDTISWIPSEIRTQLGEYEANFAAAEDFDDIKRKRWYSAIAAELAQLCVDHGEVAYHCTREAEPGEIASRGLRVLAGNGDAHRAELLVRHGHRFTEDQRQFIDNQFAKVWGDGSSARGRRGKLCLGLAHPRHWDHGCDDLLAIYGGEAVYASFGRQGPIVDVLRTIGVPAVVHFRLDVRNFKGWNENPMGQTAMWAWHRHIRPDVRSYWCEGYTTVGIPPEDVLRVECWKNK
jgi:hypothetical protein